MQDLGNEVLYLSYLRRTERDIQRNRKYIAGIRRGMRTFRLFRDCIPISAAFLIALFSLSAISFAAEANVETSLDAQTTSAQSKGFGWTVTSQFSLFKARFLASDERVNYLLDLSQKYVDQIEYEASRQNEKDLEKTRHAYQKVLQQIQKELESASPEVKLKAEQAILLQETRLSYLAESSGTAVEVDDIHDQSKYLLKSISKEKKKEAILKARETNRSDEEIENETREEEQKHSQDFRVKASQFILQAEHSFEKASEKLGNTASPTAKELLENASESLAKAQEAYDDEKYVDAIQSAFEAKHFALKAQTYIHVSRVETNETNRSVQSAFKKVKVAKKEEGADAKTIKKDSDDSLTGNAIKKASVEDTTRFISVNDISLGLSDEKSKKHEKQAHDTSPEEKDKTKSK